MVSDRHVLGNLTVGINAPIGPLRANLTQAESAATGASGRMTGAFNRFSGSVQNAASRIPVVGDSLAGLATPTGLATAAFGGFTAAIVGSVNKIVQLEQELRPMIQRSGLAAESLQVFQIAAERLGSEDGLDGVADSVQELQLRLAEAVQDGTGPAVAAFEKLGLAAEDLITKSPEEMFLAVITALQNLNNEADKKFLADELLGGSSEKLAGIINAEALAFRNLTDDIRENADIVSGEALDSARELDREIDKLKTTIDEAQTSVATKLIPTLNTLIGDFHGTEAGINVLIGRLQDGFIGAMDSVETAIVGDFKPQIVELGDGFEDLSATVLASGDSTFNPQTEGSYPSLLIDGLNTAVQSNATALQEMRTELGRHNNTIAMMEVEANRGRIERAEALAARRLEIRQQNNTAIETEDEQHYARQVAQHDEFTQVLSDAQTDYHLRWAEATAEAYANRNSAQGVHQEEVEESLSDHFNRINSQLSASIASWNAMQGENISHVPGIFGQNRRPDMTSSVSRDELEWVGEGAFRRLQHKETGEWYEYNSGDYVTRAQGDAFRYYQDRAARRNRADGSSNFATSYDAQGRYVGFGGTHDITGRTASGARTGTNVSTRRHFGLRDVGSAPPMLPGMGSDVFQRAALATAGIGGAADYVARAPGALGSQVVVNVNEGAYVVDDFVDAVASAVRTARLNGQQI